MTTIFMQRKAQGLVPCEESLEEYASIPFGKTLEWPKPKLKRSNQHNRKWHALMTIIWRNQSLYLTKDDLIEDVKIGIGHFSWKKRRYPDGTIDNVPVGKSTSFDKMDQAKFNAFYEAAVQFICRHVLPGIEGKELVKRVEEMIR